jgi:hypothetical protein
MTGQAPEVVAASISVEAVPAEEESQVVSLHSHVLCIRLQMVNKEIQRKLVLHHVPMAHRGKNKVWIIKTAQRQLIASTF